MNATPRQHSARAKLYALISSDRSTPSLARPIADALQLDLHYVATELSNMTREGYLERVARGRYIRAVRGSQS